MTATDVGDTGTICQFLDNTVKRREPLLHQMVSVTGSEELGDGAEQAARLVAPPDAITSFERRLKCWLVRNI